MGVHDGRNIRPSLIDRGMDEALPIEHAPFGCHRLAVETKLDDVILLDESRGQRTRDEEVARIDRVANADVAVGIDDTLLGEDAVGNDEVLKEVAKFAHGASLPAIAALTFSITIGEALAIRLTIR